MYKLSTHASTERLERLYYLNMEIGIGNEVCSIPGIRTGRKEVLTDTGIILILGDDDIVITAYMATINKAVAIWHIAHGDDAIIPRPLYKRIISNKKKYEKAVEIDDLFGYHEDNGTYKFFRKKT